MGVHALLPPTLPHLQPTPVVLARLHWDVYGRSRTQGWRCTGSLQSSRQGWRCTDSLSGNRRRRKTACRCFWQDPGVEVVSTANEESVLQSLTTALAAESEVNPVSPAAEEEIGDSTPKAETLLPTLQVQSLREQEKLAATPAHPDGLYEQTREIRKGEVVNRGPYGRVGVGMLPLPAMYPTFVASCFMERVWRFALPLVIAQLHKSLLPVAVVSFVGQVLPVFLPGFLSYAGWLCCWFCLHSSALYGSYFASCFVEHTWRFAWPAVIAVMHHSLLPVAVVSFVSQFVTFAAGPWVGAIMDSMPRVVAFNTLCIVQTLSMLTSAAVTIYALSGAASIASTATVLLLRPWFLLLVAASAVERLTGLASGVAFERDWVVLLAGPNRPIALAKANAILRRVELVCEIAGPFAFGLLLSKYDPQLCIMLAVGAMTVTLPVLLSLVHFTDKLSKGALQRPKHLLSWDCKTSKGSSDSQPQEVAVEGGLQAALRGWKQYLAQPVLPASLAYVLLYFNAVLAPGGLMTTYLTQQGINASLIGLFRGMCALMGFAATFLSASMISKLGVLKAGAAALFFQASVLATAVLVYWSNPLGPQTSLLLFLFLIVISRLGHWAYDMVDAQIFQTAIPATQANLVGTTEVSLASLAELVMLGVAIVANDVTYFGGLAALSMASVVGAAWVYWHWLSNPTADQRRLFPHDPHFDASEKARRLGLQTLVPSPLL